MGKAGALVTAAVVLSASLLTVGAAGASAAAGETTQGVTATTIRIGVPYVDLSAVRKFGTQIALPRSLLQPFVHTLNEE